MADRFTLGSSRPRACAWRRRLEIFYRAAVMRSPFAARNRIVYGAAWAIRAYSCLVWLDM